MSRVAESIPGEEGGVGGVRGEKKWGGKKQGGEVSEEEELGVGWRRCTITGFTVP